MERLNVLSPTRHMNNHNREEKALDKNKEQGNLYFENY